MKPIFEIIIKTIIGLIIIFIILGISINFFANKHQKNNNLENYCIDKKYSIGKVFESNDYNFCNNEIVGMCLNGKIEKQFLNNGKDLYLKFELNEFSGKTENEINEILKVDNPKGWTYNVFQNDYNNKYYAKNFNDIKRYLKLDYNNCEINLYSNLELEIINDKDNKLFNSLNNYE